VVHREENVAAAQIALSNNDFETPAVIVEQKA
jgi:hypothetical protein